MTEDYLSEDGRGEIPDIPIENIKDFLEKIADMRKNNPDEGDGQRFIFRGVKNCEYDVTPSIFRENLLNEEAKMGHLAYAKRPFEFREYDSAFERLTKLQHYGLCTRLLDVTFNPLVALYFACEKCDGDNSVTQDELGNEVENFTDGVIYWRRGYCLLHDSTEVKILSAIAETEFDAKITVESCFKKLVELHIIPKDEINKYEKNNYQIFGEVLQSNYFVIPNFSNERLIYQSGAFLLSGCININKNTDDIGISTIQKGISSLRSEFDPVRFTIPGNCKDEILDELDIYNINKSSLFPELEHQMDYIASQSKKYVRPTPVSFSKIKWTSEGDDRENKQISVDMIAKISPTIDDTERSKKKVLSTVKECTPPDISTDDVYRIFERNLVIDWYKKYQVISKIRKEITRYIESSKKYSHDDSIKWANIIVNLVISDIQKMDEVKKII